MKKISELSDWRDAINRIVCADSLNLLQKLPDESIDLVVTSPPYDNLRVYGGGGWCFETFCGIAKELARTLKDGGVIVWIVNDQVIDGSESMSSFRQALFFRECGLNLNDTMIWDKEFARYPDPIRYSNCFEFMFVFSKGKPKTVNRIKDRKNKWFGTPLHGSRRTNGDGLSEVNKEHILEEFGWRHNIWRGKTAANGDEMRWCSKHPAVFPEWLAKDHIATWSKKGDIVCDPFGGSFTTARSAKDLGRNFISCDISEDYCRIGVERLQQQVLF